MFTLEANYCNCHPATCCHDPWVIKKNGRKFITVFDRENGETVVESLNKTEQKGKNNDKKS